MPGANTQSTLWLYGKGDRFYSVAHSKSNFEACKRAGGKGSFYVFEVPSGRGHALISSPYLWRKEVIQYMRKIGFKEFY